jgi:hypothetical protein
LPTAGPAEAHVPRLRANRRADRKAFSGTGKERPAGDGVGRPHLRRLAQHEPDHILLQATRADAAAGLLDVRRLADMLSRIKGRIVHKDLDRISPLAVPIMLEVGASAASRSRAAEVEIAGLVFRHEPSIAPVEGEVCGHLHPALTVVGRGRGVRRRCFATDGHRLVLPAFGSLAGGLDLFDQAFARVLSRARTVAHLLGAERLYRIPLAAARGR